MIHKTYRSIQFKSLIILILALGIQACQEKKILPPKNENLIDIIKKRGKLKACTHYNSIDYFVYKGEPMGFQLELVQHFAKFMKVKPEFIVDDNFIGSYLHLKSGECDFIASNLAITPERKTTMDFATPFYNTHQVLIQRKPKGWENMNEKKLNEALIRNQLDWKKDSIYVQSNSASFEVVQFLKEKVGIPIHIITSNENEAEQLIGMVADGEIKYTVCGENIAKVNHAYYPNIDYKTQVSFEQPLAWAVRNTSMDLKDSMNYWLSNFMKSGEYHLLVEKYYISQRSPSILNNEFHKKKKGIISPYDKILKRVSAKYHWDWRLLASLIYQESRFQVNLEGWLGTFGIMQMMPSTAKNYGITPSSSAEKQIEGGAKYIHYLEKLIPESVKSPTEKQKFVVACYNSGPGHVLDAINLAKKYHKNPNVWEHNVDTFLTLKSKPKYFNDSVVKNGYFRGKETLRFVNDVMERYKHYKNSSR